MNTKIIITGGFILTVLILFTFSASADAINLTGKVVDSYGPVFDAAVTVRDALNDGCLNNGSCVSKNVTPNPAKTDADGNFIIRIAPPDYPKGYNITIEKDDYETKTEQVTLFDGSGDKSLGEITLRGIANIEGFISDADSGRPVDDADVTILDKGGVTDSGGRFLIENVTAGKWTLVTVEHDDYEEQKFVYNLTPGDNSLEIKLSNTYSDSDYAVNVYADYPSLIIGAGETKEFEINVKNVGRKEATFELKLLDTDKSFRYRVLNADGDEINQIYAKSGGLVKVYVEVKTPENVEKGEYKFKLKAGSGSQKSGEVSLIANVGESTGKYDFSASSMYRSKTVAAGGEVKFEVSLKNNNTDDIYRLGANAPSDWKYYVINAPGDEIAEVEVVKGSELIVYFKLEPPSDENEGEYEANLTVSSLKGKEVKVLTFQVNVRQEKKLYEIEVSSPFSKKTVMIGESIEYSINLQNKGRKKENYNLLVEGMPYGWDYKFKEASGNAPQISSVEVSADSTKNIVLQVNPPSDVGLGEYPFTVKVSGSANDTLNASIEVKGSHEMKLRIDNLYTQVDAGVKKEMLIKVQNTGLSEVRELELDVTKPEGWEVTVTPAKIPSLSPQMTAKFTLNIQAPADASIGDFKVIVKAKSQEVETDEDVIRVTVNKSSSSGYLGFAMIGGAVLILIIIFRTFGRR
jgi:uncharacterized membrane protein